MTTFLFVGAMIARNKATESRFAFSAAFFTRLFALFGFFVQQCGFRCAATLRLRCSTTAALNAICCSNSGAIAGQTMLNTRLPHPAVGAGGRSFETIAQCSLIFGSNVSSYEAGVLGRSGTDWMARSTSVNASLYRRCASRRSASRRLRRVSLAGSERVDGSLKISKP